MKESPAQRTQPQNDHPTLVVTKYMGSKKAILPFILGELERLTQPGDILVDLMAGTHTIGYALRNRCRIVANDIQRYSKVIGETLLNYIPKPRFEGAARDAFRRYYNANMRHLEELFEPGLQIERSMLKTTPGERPTWVVYRDFCEGYPYHMRSEPAQGWKEDYLVLFGRQRLEAYRTLNKLEPYNLFSTYYANTYVGVRQAAEIDSLRYAIDKLCDEWCPDNEVEGYNASGLKYLLMCGLTAALNRINPGPGHWAAFPRLSQKNRPWMVSQRLISVPDLFYAKVAEFEEVLSRQAIPYGDNIVMTEDYVKFMQEVSEYIKRAKVIYLDPPYSQGHYSRFYHLLETLALYDYPQISHSGRYRTDRHQSPFSHKQKVGAAVGVVCEAARDVKTTLVISYSKGGIIREADEFRSTLEKYYPKKKIELKRLDSVHSKMGQAERMRTEEYIFTCRP